MKEIKLLSTDKKNELNVYIWECEGKPEAILQLSHGMKEHLLRYDEFAKYISSKNILVIGNDHLGHGKSAKKEDYGYFGNGKSETVVNDLHKVTQYAKETYGNDIPYFLLGHSMGSFMARRYMMTYGNELSGIIISGTGSKPQLLILFGRFLIKTIEKFKGERYISDFITNIISGKNNDRIIDKKTEVDWLTNDEEIVKAYMNDDMCMFEFTLNGYDTLLEAMEFMQKKSNIKKIPKDLPMFFISGTDDPVGDYSKGVEKAYDDMCKASIKDVDIMLYHGGRHEMLNETIRDSVYEDVYNWIKKHIK